MVQAMQHWCPISSTDEHDRTRKRIVNYAKLTRSCIQRTILKYMRPEITEDLQVLIWRRQDHDNSTCIKTIQQSIPLFISHIFVQRICATTFFNLPERKVATFCFRVTRVVIRTDLKVHNCFPDSLACILSCEQKIKKI